MMTIVESLIYLVLFSGMNVKWLLLRVEKCEDIGQNQDIRPNNKVPLGGIHYMDPTH